ncbi:MAG: serine acetyltransferase [Kiritimatiellae bacterium]|nr:serine acetyltransferase [Kiritimatiellia bacterium]
MILTARIAVLTKRFLAALYPEIYGTEVGGEVDGNLKRIAKDLEREIAEMMPDEDAKAITGKFMEQIPEVAKRLKEDVQAAYEGDPAARCPAEIVMAYPGMYAITIHRIAHVLYTLKVPLIPRIMAELAHSRTGIDIHPGATIGRRFFIDHGTGVVIGETCIIGNDVKLYQGVTLGALSFPLDDNGLPVKGIKRHPNVEDRVVIYAGATILGGDTTIGHDSEVGGNVWLMESIPPCSRVYNKPPKPEIRRRAKCKI